MQLTEHFTLEEFQFSDTAVRKGIDNSVPQDLLDNVTLTAMGMERVRSILGKPIKVTSGYRGPKLNAAIGGAKSSAHMSGLACDFTCESYGTPLDICKRLVQVKE